MLAANTTSYDSSFGESPIDNSGGYVSGKEKNISKS